MAPRRGGHGPCRAAARWRWITPGSLLAAGLWLAASLAFSFYVSVHAMERAW